MPSGVGQIPPRIQLGGIVLCAVCALGVAFLYIRHNTAEVDTELALLRAQNAERNAQIEKLLDGYAKQATQLTTMNTALGQALQQLAAAQNLLAVQSAAMREAGKQREQEIAALPPDALASETLHELTLQSPAIQNLDNGLVGFTSDAARLNLRELVRGHAAIAELPISDQRIANLQEQIGNLQTINKNLEALVANKDAEMNARLEKAAMQQAETEKELQVAKAKGRKHNFIAGAIGFVGGLILAVL